MNDHVSPDRVFRRRPLFGPAFQLWYVLEEASSFLSRSLDDYLSNSDSLTMWNDRVKVPVIDNPQFTLNYAVISLELSVNLFFESTRPIYLYPTLFWCMFPLSKIHITRVSTEIEHRKFRLFSGQILLKTKVYLTKIDKEKEKNLGIWHEKYRTKNFDTTNKRKIQAI